MKRMDMSLPVRVYGNVLNSNIIPRVIGAIVLPGLNYNADSNVLNKIKKYRFQVLHSISKAKTKVDDHISEIKCPDITQDSFFCIGVTLAKELHIGHILLLAYAEIFRGK